MWVGGVVLWPSGGAAVGGGEGLVNLLFNRPAVECVPNRPTE